MIAPSWEASLLILGETLRDELPRGIVRWVFGREESIETEDCLEQGRIIQPDLSIRRILLPAKTRWGSCRYANHYQARGTGNATAPLCFHRSGQLLKSGGGAAMRLNLSGDRCL